MRQPGLSAIAELVGEPPSDQETRPPSQKIADHREDIPSESFPLSGETPSMT